MAAIFLLSACHKENKEDPGTQSSTPILIEKTWKLI